MKNLALILVLGIFSVLSTSCEKMFGDFLDKAPGVDVTIDTLFSSKTRVEMFLAQAYDQGMYQGYPQNGKRIGSTGYSSHNDCNAFHWSCSCDEADNPIGWYFSHTWNSGGINVGSASTEDRISPIRWNAIRIAYLLIENVDKVPDIDQTYKDQLKAEAKWLIASNYFEMLKRYGGVPIITKVYKVGEDFKVKRSSLDSTFQFIIKNLDEAAPLLPDVYPTNMKGRITKGACLALKAKTLLYAASPLFNTGTPYLQMTNPDNNKLICLGNYDVNRWKLAADAAKAVLDWAPAGGIALVTNQGVDKNYKYAWEVMDNSEIIIAEKALNGGSKGSSYTQMPWSTILPNPMGGWTGVCPTQTFIENFYDNADGSAQTPWGTAGTDLNARYANLENRFKQTIGYNMCRWNSNRPVLETFKPNGLYQNYCHTGYWMKKFIPDAQNGASNNIPVNWPYLRLNEQYLIYAEALNEFNSSPPAEAYTAVNTIRARSGMPALPAGLTQAQFRDRIRKEWGAEFAFEDHRFWDIKRWMIAEDQSVMQGPIYVLYITKFGTATPQQFQYARSVLENRVWNRFTYLNPFQTSEVNKGYVVQNPGY